MAVTIRPMTGEEFDFFRGCSANLQAEDLMRVRGISREEAAREAEEDLSRMLPKGLRTQDNFLMTVENERSETVGFLWTLHESSSGRQQSFLCDLLILEPYRRQGYAAAALTEMEILAARTRCEESVLFVANHNHAAIGLYQKCGYRLLRQMDYGKYMIKRL